MTARELLGSLLDTFREGIPGAVFQEAYSPEPASRRREKPLITGQVEEEVLGAGWEARLGFALYLPGSVRPGEGLEIAGKMVEAAQREPLFAEAVLGPAQPEKALGGLKMICSLRFAQGNGGSGGGSCPVTLNGTACRVSGWKETLGGRETVLTATGEREPFYRGFLPEFTVELQGLDRELALLEGFTLRLGASPWMYTGCQWKSFTAAGTGVLSAAGRVKAEEEGG